MLADTPLHTVSTVLQEARPEGPREAQCAGHSEPMAPQVSPAAVQPGAPHWTWQRGNHVLKAVRAKASKGRSKPIPEHLPKARTTQAGTLCTRKVGRATPEQKPAQCPCQVARPFPQAQPRPPWGLKLTNVNMRMKLRSRRSNNVVCAGFELQNKISPLQCQEGCWRGLCSGEQGCCP